MASKESGKTDCQVKESEIRTSGGSVDDTKMLDYYSGRAESRLKWEDISPNVAKQKPSNVTSM